LIDTLDNCDDVQGVYGNFEINQDTLSAIEV
jgi:transcriptional/translational regulatory protein YebC/TACO1